MPPDCISNVTTFASSAMTRPLKREPSVFTSSSPQTLEQASATMAHNRAMIRRRMGILQIGSTYGGARLMRSRSLRQERAPPARPSVAVVRETRLRARRRSRQRVEDLAALLQLLVGRRVADAEVGVALGEHVARD